MSDPPMPPAARPAGSGALESSEWTLIEPPATGWYLPRFRELWTFRELAWVLMRRDVRVRYRQTFLGASWAILRPLLAMLVFSGVFGSLARLPSDGYPYVIWVYAGLLPWSFFASSVTASGASLLGASHLVTKVYFPRLLLPVAAVGVPVVDLGVASLILFGLLFGFGLAWSWTLLLLPLLTVALGLTALGFGLLVAAYSAAYRDLQQLLPFGLQLWMFLSPVVYPPSLVPEGWRWLFYLNPLAGWIESFRSACLGRPVELRVLGVSAAVSAVALIAGLLAFVRRERQFADVL